MYYCICAWCDPVSRVRLLEDSALFGCYFEAGVSNSEKLWCVVRGCSRHEYHLRETTESSGVGMNEREEDDLGAAGGDATTVVL